MATFDLSKGSIFDLSKDAPASSRFNVGLSWTPGSGATCDLDLSAFGCAYNDSQQPLVVNQGYVIFYKQTTSPCGGIVHSGDDTTGSNSDGGDDEVIAVDTKKIDSRVQEISFVVSIFDAVRKQQDFSMIRDGKVHIVDADSGAELASFRLTDDYRGFTAVQLGSLFQENGKWSFQAIGQGFRAPAGLADFIHTYMPEADVRAEGTA